MFKYNNSHIFTSYLKQLLSSFNLPTCKIYTREFARYLEQHGTEDPRVLESFDGIDKINDVRINYLKNDSVYSYHCKYSELNQSKASWKHNPKLYYSSEKNTPGLTRTLSSPGRIYDTKTHEYLGDYLRFLRDYYNINLMSMYNCFSDKIYNNIYFSFVLNQNATQNNNVKVMFNSQDPEYRVYALPVKLFAEYTIAVDCNQGIELFCGLYNTNLELSEESEELARKTYQRVHKTLFNQPFLYKKLDIEHWPAKNDFNQELGQIRTDILTRWDIINREKDLKLFIKVPASCKSTITILEGDFRYFNNNLYSATKNNKVLTYQQNHSILNFNTMRNGDNVDLNSEFKPISKLQLLALNTGESHPFADRLVEYLSGSAITKIDEISDNIKRVQRVMKKNSYYFKIEGIWEDKMQKILYDYIMNSGPVELDKNANKLIDRRNGYYKRLGHTAKSTVYDILGYVDKDAERLYASWKKENGEAKVGSSLQNIDIYDGLYDIK